VGRGFPRGRAAALRVQARSEASDHIGGDVSALVRTARTARRASRARAPTRRLQGLEAWPGGSAAPRIPDTAATLRRCRTGRRDVWAARRPGRARGAACAPPRQPLSRRPRGTALEGVGPTGPWTR
jgi:hypothetical protein